MQRRLRSAVMLAAAVCVPLAAAGCDERTPTEAGGTQPPGEPLETLQQPNAPPVVLGSFSFSAEASDGSTPWQGIGVEVPPNTWVKVRVTGVTLERNPPFQEYCNLNQIYCFPREGEYINPWDQMVGPRFTFGATPVPPTYPAGPYLAYPSSESGVGELLYLNTYSTSRYVWVHRPSPEGEIACPTPCTGSVEQYRYGSGQVLTVTRVPTPVRVWADREWTLSTDSVVFTGAASEILRKGRGTGAPDSLHWMWFSRDTGAVHNGLLGGTPVQHCEGKLTCKYAPSRSGRMQVYASADGWYAENFSQVVWVDGPKLILNCTSSVTRGQSATCTASTSPSTASLQVTGWRFNGTDGTEVAPPAGASQNSAVSWDGKMVTGGTITVTGTVTGRPQSAVAAITVTPRVWPKMSVVGHDGGHGTLPDPPKRYGDLGKTLERPIPNQVVVGERVNSGPNEGFWFIPTPITQLRATVYISRAFTPGHPWYQMQHSGPTGTVDAADTPIPYCTKTEIRRLERVTRQHEGLLPGGAQPSHVAAMNSFFQENDPQAGLEASVAHESRIGEMGFAGYFNIQYDTFVQAPLIADGRHKEIENGGQVPLPPFSCEARF